MKTQLQSDATLPALLRRDLLGDDVGRQERARAELRKTGDAAALAALTDLLRRSRPTPLEYLPRALNVLGPLCTLVAVPTRSSAWTVVGFGLMLAGSAIDFGLSRRRPRRESLLEMVAEEAARTEAGAQHLLDALILARADRRRRVETLRTALHAPLPRLLARLTDDEARALTDDQRTLLRRAVHARAEGTSRSPWDYYSLEFSTAALLVLASARDDGSLDDAATIVAGHDNERLRAAAEEYLRAVRG